MKGKTNGSGPDMVSIVADTETTDEIPPTEHQLEYLSCPPEYVLTAEGGQGIPTGGVGGGARVAPPPTPAVPTNLNIG
jgi:hypothetical protein